MALCGMHRLVGNVSTSLATERCVRCLRRPAHLFCGHVLQGRRRVGAGWCKACIQWSTLVVPPGWIGHWVKPMGIQRWPS